MYTAAMIQGFNASICLHLGICAESNQLVYAA